MAKARKIPETHGDKFVGKRVAVAFNLHKAKKGPPQPGEYIFTVREKPGGRVLAHVNEIALADVTPKILRGTLRSIKEKGVRSVCCYLVGTVVAARDVPTRGRKAIHFNPFRADCFTIGKGPTCLGYAGHMLMTEGRKTLGVGVLAEGSPLIGNPRPKKKAAKKKAPSRRKGKAGSARVPLRDYNMDVVGDDIPSARRIARALQKGIKEAADICEISPPVCVDNLGRTRDKMPQVEAGASVQEMLASDDPEENAKAKAILAAGGPRKDTRTVQQQFLDRLERAGVKTDRRRVPVGTLKATQKEIRAAHAYRMADSHLRGSFPNIDKQIVISRDNYILDGHHRWAALLSIDPARYMSVLRVGLPMTKLLDEAAATPGVYRADFSGRPLSDAEQRAYKRASKSELVRGPARRARPKPKAKPKRKPPKSRAKTTTKSALMRAVREAM